MGQDVYCTDLRLQIWLIQQMELRATNSAFTATIEWGPIVLYITQRLLSTLYLTRNALQLRGIQSTRVVSLVLRFPRLDDLFPGHTMLCCAAKALTCNLYQIIGWLFALIGCCRGGPYGKQVALINILQCHLLLPITLPPIATCDAMTATPFPNHQRCTCL